VKGPPRLVRALGVLGLLGLLGGVPAFGADAKGPYKAMTLAQLGAFPCEDPQSYDSPIDAWANAEKPKAKKPAKTVIPDWVKKLDGAKVAVSGFMVPFDVQDDGVLSFSIVKSILICCFGQTPRVNENVMCQMPEGKPAKFLVNIPLRVSGTLHVAEVHEDGYLVSLYSMDVDAVEVIENPDPELLKGSYRAVSTTTP
jgi:hypothetical protein